MPQQLQPDMIKTAGKLAGRATRQVMNFWDTVKTSRSRIAYALFSKEDIRRIVAEEVPRYLPEKENLSLQAYERRLQVFSERLHALQETIAELQLSGQLNQKTVAQTIGSIQADDQLNADEKSILATILNQNILLQKPELVKNSKPESTSLKRSHNGQDENPAERKARR
ncbi:MAG: hypothetical protein HQL19_04170 [Candidatus Omnitrophica bacterium]|nr:hypothetical protein [Candidatus Omnitrophota bacterium]